MKRSFILFFTLMGAISGSAQSLELRNTQEKDGEYHFKENSLITYPLENPVTHGDSFSVSVWMQYDSLLREKSHLINVSDEACGTFQQTLYAHAGKLEFFSGASCGSDFNYITTEAPQLKKWYHYVIVTHNKTVSLYVNTNKVGSTPVSTSATDTAKRIYFGGHHTYAEFFGRLKNIAFYNKGLTEQEIINIYTDINFPTKTEAGLYTKRQTVPPGFSMINIPFSYRDNSVGALFGIMSDIVIYNYDYHGGWLINYYDREFEEWDTPNHVISAGTPIWILNNTKSNININFQGKIPTSWRPSIGGVK